MKPISQLILCKVIRNALIMGVSLEEVVSRMAMLPSSLSKEPWANIIYDTNLGTIISGSGHSDFLVDLLCHSIGIDSSATKKDVKKKYGEYYGKSTKEIPNYLVQAKSD